ncbi:MAG TPA: DUF721 domain-containing protein [Desulfomonilia bacterium]
MKGKELDRLGNHLGVISKDIYRLLKIKSQWREIAGEVFAGHTVPARLKGSKLEVLCDSSVWVQQVGLLELTLIESIRKITNLRIKEIDSKIGVLKPEAQPGLKKSVPVKLDIDSQVYENIKNPELREKIKALIKGS